MLHTTTPSVWVRSMRRYPPTTREGWERAEESNPHHSGHPISPTAQSVFHPSWLLSRCHPSTFGFVFVHRAIKIHSRVCQERIPVDNTDGRPNHACEWF